MEERLGEGLVGRLAEGTDGRRKRSGSHGQSRGRAAAVVVLVLLVLIFYYCGGARYSLYVLYIGTVCRVYLR